MQRRDTRSLSRTGEILAVRSAEIAAIVWTLGGLDAFADPADSLAAWRERLQETAAAAAQADHVRAGLVEAKSG